MTYLDALDHELAAAGIPMGRRRRILAEFADHLHEDADAKLGAPRDLAEQFADELGTQVARAAAFRSFAALAFSGLGVVAMFLAVGRMRGLTISGYKHVSTPTWTTPVLLVAALAAQIAFAAGCLALLRAWRLRNEPVIGRPDAIVLARRSAVGLASGAVTMAALPAAALAFPHTAGHTWSVLAWVVGGLAVVALASAAPTVVDSFRLRPARGGAADDLRADLGPWLPQALTPVRLALLLTAVIVVVMGLAGVVTDDPYDGLARGLLDGVACLAGFVVLGRYLGLRTAS
jgi:hypothetical protein